MYKHENPTDPSHAPAPCDSHCRGLPGCDCAASKPAGSQVEDVRGSGEVLLLSGGSVSERVMGQACGMLTASHTIVPAHLLGASLGATNESTDATLATCNRWRHRSTGRREGKTVPRLNNHCAAAGFQFSDGAHGYALRRRQAKIAGLLSR
jgi:hypothetical protein